MGISPIVSLAPLPVTRTLDADVEPVSMERVENSARTGDETYSPSHGKSSQGNQDEGEEIVTSEEEFKNLASADESEDAAEGQAPSISFLA
jgi:hypothetical protein